jgi:hypothetical protein
MRQQTHFRKSPFVDVASTVDPQSVKREILKEIVQTPAATPAHQQRRAWLSFWQLFASARASACGQIDLFARARLYTDSRR